MCRYAWHNYRDHFACFDCRKAFKHWQWQEVNKIAFCRRQRLEHVPRQIVCPDCTKPMADMGLDFKAPSQRDAEAWEVLRALHAHGYTFHSCGCSVGWTPPRSVREVPEWLERRGQRSDGEQLRERFANRKSK